MLYYSKQNRTYTAIVMSIMYHTNAHN